MRQVRDRVERHVVGAQPGMPRAAPQRRLVDGGGKPAGRRRRQCADIAGPAHIVEHTGGALHARDFEIAAEPGKRPVQRARQPRRPGLLAGERGAAPLVAAVEKPDAGIAERRGDRRDLADIGRARAPEPAAGDRVDARQQPWSRRAAARPRIRRARRARARRLRRRGAPARRRGCRRQGLQRAERSLRFRSKHHLARRLLPSARRHCAARWRSPRSAFAPVRPRPDRIPARSSRSRPGSRGP